MAWLRDPLIIFGIVGAGIYFAADWLGEADVPYAIDIRTQDLQRLSSQWALQMRRPPSEQELARLVEQFVQEEIYYREAQRLGLDYNDTIVRRRLVQKLTFLTEDIATATPLEEPELRAYYADHVETYRVPERFSFQHRYFSSDRRVNAKIDATAALTDANNSGDPFMLQQHYRLRSAAEIGNLFGRQFANALSAFETSKQWQGPLESAYGWHAVLLTDKQSATIKTFEQVRKQVVADAQRDVRTAANEAYFTELKARYEIRYPREI